jgi:RNA polymerase sigma-70 factor (ECF subfamily)
MARETAIHEELVAHVPAMRAFARSLTRDHASADDLVQEAVLKAWSNLDKFEEGTNLRAWLFTILRNTFYSIARKRKWEVEDVDGLHAARLPQKPEQEGVMELEDFKAAFATLPVEQREALILVGASGLSYEEAAGVCECAVGTVKSRVNRARARLADILYGGEADAGETSALTMAAMIAPPGA